MKTKKNKNIIIFVGVALVVIAVSWFWFKKRKNDGVGSVLNTTLGNLPTTKAPNTSVKKLSLFRANNWPIGKSTKAIEVAYLQTWLNHDYQNNLNVDGIWGSKTDAAYRNLWPVNMAFYGKVNLSEDYYDFYIKLRENELRSWAMNNYNIQIE